jgi:hypothetical protein
MGGVAGEYQYDGTIPLSARGAVLKSGITSIPVEQDAVPLLGQGYDTDRELIRGTCLNGRIVSHGSSTGVVNLETSLSQEELAKRLGVSLSGKYGSGAFKVSARASFVRSSFETSNSFVLIYSSTFNFPNEIYVVDAGQPLSGTGVGAIANGLPAYRETCGNRFIQQQEVGGALYFSIKFEFQNE